MGFTQPLRDLQRPNVQELSPELMYPTSGGTSEVLSSNSAHRRPSPKLKTKVAGKA
jgi:hypothetical protein